MGIASIVVIAFIVVCSIAAIFVAKDPVDTVAETEAALYGMGMRPLASRVVSKDGGRYDVPPKNRVQEQFRAAAVQRISVPVAIKPIHAPYEL